jgi:hypothetical protein
MLALRSRPLLGVLALSCLVSAPSASTASPLPSTSDQPILVIGSSYADGRLPFDDSLQAPFGGLAVGFGSYLGEGDALVRQGMFVVNEAQAGATSFDRAFCLASFCVNVGWQGYDKQLTKALARVTIRNPADPTQVLGYNASYVYISLANDCLHSGAAGVPQLESAPCSQAEIDAFVDRVIDVAEDAMDVGLVPIFSRYPDYDDIDLAMQAAGTGLVWYADAAQWDAIATTYETRIADELPGAILVNAWHNMEVLPDGLHPTPKSANKAAKRIREAIAAYEAAAQ